MKDILAVMGAVYTRSEIYEWVREQIKNRTKYYRDAVIMSEAYGLWNREPWDRRYMIVRTADYPKSASANGNRDGEYMLRRVPKRAPRRRPSWERTTVYKYKGEYYWRTNWY